MAPSRMSPERVPTLSLVRRVRVLGHARLAPQGPGLMVEQPQGVVHGLDHSDPVLFLGRGPPAERSHAVRHEPAGGLREPTSVLAPLGEQGILLAADSGVEEGGRDLVAQVLEVVVGQAPLLAQRKCGVGPLT